MKKSPNQQDRTSKNDESLNNIIKNIKSFYWIPFIGRRDLINEICELVEKDCIHLALPLKSFNSNLIAAEKILNLPYLLIQPRIVDGIFKTYSREFLEKINTDKDELRKHLGEFNKSFLDKSGHVLEDRKHELQLIMYQACILFWSALENLSKDVFILILNRKPKLYSKIVNNNFLKDKLGLSQGIWEKLLEEHDYDLNGKLGYIIANNKDFSMPKLLQEVFGVILNEYVDAPDAIDSFFKSDDLWLLGQRRHLIAHKCGIVDQEYMNKTNDLKQTIGEPLVLRGDDIENARIIVGRCAIVLYATARHLWERPKVDLLDNL